MKFYCSHHRFNFLKYSNIFKNEVTDIFGFPIPKTCLVEHKNSIAMIEYTDGIDGLVTSIDEKKYEASESIYYPVLFTRFINQNKDLFKNKKIFYIRPNKSKIFQKNIKSFLNKNNIELRHIHPWSYFLQSCIPLISNRNNLHKKVINNIESIKKSYDFIGDPRKTNEGYIKEYKPNGIPYMGYGIRANDFKELEDKNFKIEENHFYKVRDRYSRLKSFEKKYGNTNIIKSLNPEKYIDYLSSNSYLTIHPHGASVRHSVYESMSIGVIPVIEKTTYNKSIWENCNILEDSFKDLETNKNIENLLKMSTNEYKERSELIFNYFTKNMMPDPIMKEIKEILS